MATTGGDNFYLPPEIITNLSKRLPVKSILRFRSVCKDWKNLFKSPSFIAEHYRHSQKNPLLISYSLLSHGPEYSPLCLFRYNLEARAVEISTPKVNFPRRVTEIIGYSNGLLCIQIGYPDEDPPPSLLLLNPATREVKQVPRSTNYRGNHESFGQAFGYSPVLRDYKIVTVHGRDETKRVEVFSLRTGSWKEVEPGIKPGVTLRSNPATVNGTVFWLGWNHERGMIVSFDLETEVFTLMRMPCSCPASVTPVGVLGCVVDVYDENKVGMLRRVRGHGTFELRLWLLEEGSGGAWNWTKEYSIQPIEDCLYPLCFWRDEIVCLKNWELRDFLFHLTTKNELKKFLSPLNEGVYFFPSPYVESLVSMCDPYGY